MQSVQRAKVNNLELVVRGGRDQLGSIGGELKARHLRTRQVFDRLYFFHFVE